KLQGVPAKRRSGLVEFTALEGGCSQAAANRVSRRCVFNTGQRLEALHSRGASRGVRELCCKRRRRPCLSHFICHPSTSSERKISFSLSVAAAFSREPRERAARDDTLAALAAKRGLTFTTFSPSAG